MNGWYHGCLCYTHTIGSRNRYGEFSYGILKNDRPAGLLVMLDETTGKPKVDPTTTLSGLKIVDVNGWAPTEDGLALVNNECTKKPFVDYTFVVPETAKNANDAAMEKLTKGDVDAMWVYADQAKNYQCDDPEVDY